MAAKDFKLGPLFGILAAGGKGVRMGGRKKPKQFLILGGQPVFTHALDRLFLFSPIREVVVTVPADWVSRCRDLIPDRWKSRTLVVEGGETRQESVRRGLEALKPDEAAWVMVHDAARPLLPQSLIDRLLQGARPGRGVIPVIPAADSLAVVNGNEVGKYLDRSLVRQVQTPQLFPFQTLLDAHRQAAETESLFADDGSLVAEIGCRVIVVDGDPANLKITRQEDLRLAEFLLPTI